MRELFAQQLFFLARVVVRDADQRLESGLTQRTLRGFEQIDEEGIGQHRNQDRHVRAVPRRQRACSRVGDVAEPLGSRAHAFNQIRVDGASARQGARDRDRADVGGAGNVGQRDAAGRTRAGRAFLAHVVRMESKKDARKREKRRLKMLLDNHYIPK